MEAMMRGRLDVTDELEWAWRIAEIKSFDLQFTAADIPPKRS